MNEYTYEIPLDFNGQPKTDVIVRSDGAWIPVNPNNSDYQVYLKSLKK